jgi:RNAse (barnase) inhibitor barstar
VGTNDGAVGARYSLTSDDDPADFWGYVQDVSGLFVPEDDDGGRRVELLGCEPRGALLAATGLMGTKRTQAGNADLDFLDEGRLIASYFVNWVTVERCEPSARHGQGRSDLTVTLWRDGLLPQAEWIWGLVRRGLLSRKGMWHDLDADGRHAWLSVALNRRAIRRPIDQPAGASYSLDASHITDVDGFYCAIGEAVNGPGGYFGWNLSALDDCLRGGWGAITPFTLIWNDSTSAMVALREDGDDPVWLPMLMEIFSKPGVSLDLR